MFVIGTAGHVDHGKSLLVEALTGIDPDRLGEEKARGMTIDLGFAWLTLPSGRTVSIVDVPGHERFIKNMLAGAGGVDLALLVVAADDGVMPQTREHLAILDLLGVSRGVVALTKRDLVDEDWADLVTADIVELLAPTGLAGSPVVPCSAVTRQGLDDLVQVLDEAVGSLAPKRDIGRPRLPIDRVFTMGGFGTVVTGTLIDGEFAVGDELEVVPGGMRVRVRGLQSHRDKVERAGPGTRTAVNVAGIDRDALRRGLVLAKPGTLRQATVIDVRLQAVAGASHPIRHNMNVTFHAFADECGAQVRLLEAGDLRPGASAWAQIRLSAPVAVVRGDRFVLRTPNDTIAGGVIVDTSPKRHRRGDAAVVAALEVMLSDDAGDIVMAAIRRHPLASRHELMADAGVTSSDVDDAVARLREEHAIVSLGEETDARLIARDDLERIAGECVAAIAAYHREHPLRAGIPQEELRSRLRLDPRKFGLIADATGAIRTEGGTVALRDFAPALSAAQRAAADAWMGEMRRSPGQAGSIPSPEAAVVAHLVERGEVVDAGEGIMFEGSAFASMTERVRAHIEREGTITLAQTRDLFGTSRKYAQAFLEHLDRLRVTRRVGDERVLRG